MISDKNNDGHTNNNGLTDVTLETYATKNYFVFNSEFVVKKFVIKPSHEMKTQLQKKLCLLIITHKNTVYATSILHWTKLTFEAVFTVICYFFIRTSWDRNLESSNFFTAYFMSS